MPDRHDSTDAEWVLLEPLLPDRTLRRGGQWGMPDPRFFIAIFVVALATACASAGTEVGAPDETSAPKPYDCEVDQDFYAELDPDALPQDQDPIVAAEQGIAELSAGGASLQYERLSVHEQTQNRTVLVAMSTSKEVAGVVEVVRIGDGWSTETITVCA